MSTFGMLFPIRLHIFGWGAVQTWSGSWGWRWGGSPSLKLVAIWPATSSLQFAQTLGPLEGRVEEAKHLLKRTGMILHAECLIGSLQNCQLSLDMFRLGRFSGPPAKHQRAACENRKILSCIFKSEAKGKLTERRKTCPNYLFLYVSQGDLSRV